MAFQAVPDVAHIRYEGRVDGQLTVNDLYFEVSGGGITPVNLLALTGAVASWVTGSIVPLVCDSWTGTQVVGRDLTVQNGAVAAVTVGQPGEVTTEAVPNNVAACVSFRTGVSGRSFHGRNYVAAIPNAQVTLNTIDSALIIALVEAYTQLVGAGTFLAGWQWGVVSRVTAGAPRANGIITPIDSVLFTTPYVRSMRSREIGHGA